jgi:hypothetical protein
MRRIASPTSHRGRVRIGLEVRRRGAGDQHRRFQERHENADLLEEEIQLEPCVMRVSAS